MSFERVYRYVQHQRDAKRDFLDYNHYQANLLRNDFTIERVVRCTDGKAVLTIKTTKAMTWGVED